VISPKAAFAGLRQKRPFVDHLVRTVGRYQADTGDRLAAAVTFYWFLSLFPVLLVAIYLFRLVKGDSAVADVQSALSGYLPGNLVQTIGETIGENAGKAGIVGAVGLLFSGLGWIDALREAIRTMWHQNVTAGNFIVRRAVDVLVLVGLFATIAASVFVTGLAGSGPRYVLEQLGVDKSLGAVVFLKVVGLLLAGLADVALFVYLFVRLARVPTPIREVLKGAVFGAVGFAVLKLVGGYYVQRTTTKGEATYGAFAVVVGLLLFLNLVSRLILVSAAFVVTGPYDSDTRPSGTADPEQAQRAGIPEEYADTDMNLQEDGAPTPLRAAVQGRVPPQDEPEGTDVEQSWAGRAAALPVAPGEPAPVPDAGELKGARQVTLAARVLSAVAGLALVAVALHVLRTVRGLLRR
jgi:membrane protein